MELVVGKHWLEEAIGESRDADEIVDCITQHPAFRKVIEGSIAFAKAQTNDRSQETRLIAEHIASVLHRAMGTYTSSHY